MKSWGFFTSIQPWSSQFGRCEVSPSITYLVSHMISSREKWEVVWIAVMTAVISPTWLDWLSPGTLIAWFCGSLFPDQMPAPQATFAFPLLKHAPSVCTVILLCLMCWFLLRHWAGDLDIFSGSVKILKQSANSF